MMIESMIEKHVVTNLSSKTIITDTMFVFQIYPFTVMCKSKLAKAD